MSGNVLPFLETGETDARPLPANVEAEQALLGALLSENGLIDAVADVVQPSDFYEPLHQRIYEAALQEASAGRSASPVTLKGRFADDPDMAAVGANYLMRLTADGQGLFAALDLARLIHDLARRRDIAGKLGEALSCCLDENMSLSAVADMVTASVSEGPADGLIELSAGACVENHLRAAAEGVAGVTSGNRVPAFDKVVGALRPKHFVLLAARPGMGKTALSMSYAIGAARAGHGVLFISLEMSGEELGGRAAADMCYGLDGEDAVPYHAISAGRLNPWERERVSRAAVDLDRMPLVIVDAPSITPARLGRLVRRHARRFEARGVPLQLVVVDYVQRMKPDRQMSKKYEEISEISAALKDIAKANGVAIMALAQLSREVERRGDKRPVLADLRDSGQLEQDADTVIFLLRQEYYHRQSEPDQLALEWQGWKEQLDRMTGEIEFIVAKRRGGETGTAKGLFLGAYQAVRG